MWIPKTVDWPREVVDAIKNKELRFFVGNGLSRLSGAPGWLDLFKTSAAQKAFEHAKIDLSTCFENGVSVLELGEFLKLRDEAAWKSVLRPLMNWNNADPKKNLSHELVTLLTNGTQTPRFITTNVDGLLGTAGVVYLHGSPTDPIEAWTFAESDYRAKLQNIGQKLIAAMAQGVTVFIGYGHSYEDFDIWHLLQQPAVPIAAMYSLVSTNQLTPLLRFRLTKHNISPIEYDLPVYPNSQERLLGLCDALHDLCTKAERKPDDGLTHQLASLKESVIAPYRKAVVTLGLASMNSVASPSRFPTRSRVSIRAQVHRDTGGPALIVSRVLQACGRDSFIVSKISADANGKAVMADLSAPPSDKQLGRVHLEFLEISTQREFATWNSYVIEDPDSPFQRVFIDTAIDRKLLEIDSELVARLKQDLKTHKPQFIYYDKFFRNTILDLFHDLNEPFDDAIWTVYETGSDGDRFYETTTNPPKPHPYFLEEKTARSANVVVSSFRFARDFLATSLSADQKRQLAFDEILNATEQDTIIANLVNDVSLLNGFIKAVANGSHQWLRMHQFRLCVITLHKAGCLWLMLDPKGDYKHGHVRGVPVAEPRHTTSAGDVFRGAFVAALATCRELLPITELMTPARIDGLCQFANVAAAQKVGHSTVKAILPDLADKFSEWKASL